MTQIRKQQDKFPIIRAVESTPLTTTSDKGAPPASVTPQLRPPASPAALRPRHWGLALSFLLMVLMPTTTALWYLQTRAADQYASRVGFSVRKEGSSPAIDLLGGLSGVSSGRATDSDILYEFIQSQEMVQRVDARLNLRRLFSKPARDPLFAFDPTGSIEDLRDYWQRMVKVSYDAGTGLIDIRVTAFDPRDARTIAREIFSQSSRMINHLSAIARDDATRYAKKDLDVAAARLKAIRQKITAFRSRFRILDPKADIRGQMGLLNTLHQQMAEALIQQDMLRQTTRANDPRIAEARRRIGVIQRRITAERKKFGLGPTRTTPADSTRRGDGYSVLLSRYEGLSVERDFAERAYLSARTAFDSARAEAQRQSRYLAAYVEPTLAQTAEYPRRGLILSLLAGFLFLIWSILSLVAYSIKDRR